MQNQNMPKDLRSLCQLLSYFTKLTKFKQTSVHKQKKNFLPSEKGSPTLNPGAAKPVTLLLLWLFTSFLFKHTLQTGF